MKYVKFVFHHVINLQKIGLCVNTYFEMCIVLSVFPALVDKLTGALSSDSASSSQTGTAATPEFVKGKGGPRSPSSGLSSTISTPTMPCSVKASPHLEGFMAEVYCECFINFTPLIIVLSWSVYRDVSRCPTIYFPLYYEDAGQLSH